MNNKDRMINRNGWEYFTSFATNCGKTACVYKECGKESYRGFLAIKFGSPLYNKYIDQDIKYILSLPYSNVIDMGPYLSGWGIEIQSEADEQLVRLNLDMLAEKVNTYERLYGCIKMDNPNIPVSKERLSEIATVSLHLLDEMDDEADYTFKYDLELTDEEAEYFGFADYLEEEI